MQSDREEDSSKQLGLEIVLKGAAEPSGDLFSHYSATALGEERTVSFGDLLVQRDHIGNFSRQTELRRQRRRSDSSFRRI